MLCPENKRYNTKLVGILNVTNDSFSDGGLYVTTEAAMDHAKALFEQGADIVELGPASSHPDAENVSAKEEIQRLAPLFKQFKGPRETLCVDSCHVETQEYSIAQGVGYINDIKGFPIPSFYPTLAQAACHLIVMHSVQGTEKADREWRERDRVVAGIYDFFEKRLASLTDSGVAKERLILDPGMGFFLGGDPRTSLAVLRELGPLKTHFGLPILISVSRKSFLGTLTGRSPSERAAASLVAEIFSIEQGASYIRTHEPGSVKDALCVLSALNDKPSL